MSHESVSPDPELNAIEAALGSLVPARSRIDRDRVMFRAGQAANRPSPSGRHAWMAIAASLGLVALGEAALLAHGPRPWIVERVVVVVHDPATSPVGPTPAHNAAQAQAQAQAQGSPVPVPAMATTAPGDFTLLGRTARERLAGQLFRYGLDGLPASPSAAWVDHEPWAASSRQRLQEELRKVLESGDPS